MRVLQVLNCYLSMFMRPYFGYSFEHHNLAQTNTSTAWLTSLKFDLIKIVFIFFQHKNGAIHYAITHCKLPPQKTLQVLVDGNADVNLQDDVSDGDYFLSNTFLEEKRYYTINRG